MIELALTQDSIDYGRRKYAAHQRQGANARFSVPGNDKRWTGHAVEYVLHQWLAEHEIPHVWNGGMDDKPDFVLGGRGGMGIACKSNSGDGPRQDFIFTISEHQVNRLAGGALFNIVQVRDRKVWIAGYIDAQVFRATAERKRKGEEGFVAGRPILYNCRVIPASQLTPAETFFEMLRRAAA